MRRPDRSPPCQDRRLAGKKSQRSRPLARMIRCGRRARDAKGDRIRTDAIRRDRTRDVPRRPGAGPGRPRAVEEAGDARLVEQARAGDDRAFATLVARYERALIRVLARLVRDEELARDLAQETFWKVYNRLDRFDTAPAVRPLAVPDRGQPDARRPPPPRAAAAPPRSTGSADDGRRAFELPDPDPRIRAELAQEVQFVLEKIPIAYRTILVLRDLEGFSSAEVAAIVGRREATVRWRLAKARDLFREHWERRHDLTRREATSWGMIDAAGSATACRCWPAASWGPSGGGSSGT